MKAKNWRRGLLIIWGILILAWLPLEDPNILSPTLFAYLLAAIALSYRNPNSLTHWMLTGVAFGLLGIAATLFLMLFKTGIHNHGFPEYPIESFKRLLDVLPYAILIGGLAGALANWLPAKQLREKK